MVKVQHLCMISLITLHVLKEIGKFYSQDTFFEAVDQAKLKHYDLILNGFS